MKLKITLIIVISLLLGILVGGYLFSKTQPRSFLALNDCQNKCFNINELTGLLASVGIQNFPGLIPEVVMETDKTIVVKHPNPQASIHYLVLPKKDIKDITEIGILEDDYLTDAFNVMRTIIEKEKLKDYKVVTNGSGIQLMRYLLFHLMAEN